MARTLVSARARLHGEPRRQERRTERRNRGAARITESRRQVAR
jgi:hypothetical protein